MQINRSTSIKDTGSNEDERRASVEEGGKLLGDIFFLVDVSRLRRRCRFDPVVLRLDKKHDLRRPRIVPNRPALHQVDVAAIRSLPECRKTAPQAVILLFSHVLIGAGERANLVKVYRLHTKARLIEQIVPHLPVRPLDDQP